MQYRLIIKGSVRTALAAMRAHGLGPTTTRIRDMQGQVSLTVEGDRYDAEHVAHWFSSGPISAPYPAGALLWYAADKAGLEDEDGKALESKLKHRIKSHDDWLDALDASIDRIDGKLARLGEAFARISLGLRK